MNIRRKNITLILGFLGILLIGYVVSISETITLKKHYKTLKHQEELYANIPQRLFALEQKEKHYDSLMDHYQITETSLQNNLLKTIERYAMTQSLRATSFDEPHSVHLDGRQLSSYAFTVTGDFQSILGLAYHLEQKSKFGMIANVHFEKQKSYRTGKESLQGHFVLQLIQ
jgi:hypothetical protein